MPIVSLTLPAASVVAAYLLGRHRSRRAVRLDLDSELARQRAERACTRAGCPVTAALSELLPPVLMLEASRQLHSVLRSLPDAPDGYTPGQRLIAAAVLTEAAEARTREAEACTICASWPGLCYTCRLLSGQASSLRELAAGLAGEVTSWASTSGCLV